MTDDGPIVIATDLSPAGALAADLALPLVRALKRPCHLVCVANLLVRHENLPAPIAPFAAALEKRVLAQTDSARAGLDKERARLAASAPEVQIEAHVLDGRPWEALVRHADSVGASLVVLGPHGQGGPTQLKRGKVMEWLLGSTADRLVRHGKTPLLVAAKEAKGNPLQNSLEGGKFIVALDFEASSTSALDAALAWARALGAEVEVLHVLEALPVWDHASGELAPSIPEPHDPQLEESIALEGLRNYVTERASAAKEVKVSCRVLRGDAAEIIAEEGHHGSLLVIGTHGRSGLAHALLGSVAERVLRRASVPVLTVRA